MSTAQSASSNGHPGIADPAVRQALKRALEEIIPGLVADALDHRGPGHDDPVPQVPAPPVAAVHRPGDRAAGAAGAGSTAGATTAETVSIRDDAELDAFVQLVLRRAETPEGRSALASGRARFTFGHGGDTRPAGGSSTHRVDRGAVTERTVEKAATAGARLLLGPGAVLTPLGRDRARALGVTIEKEKRC